MKNRETDIQKLCDAILEMSPDCYDDPNGGYETRCPFCGAYAIRTGRNAKIFATLDEIEHDSDCLYLMAKKLSSELNEKQ